MKTIYILILVCFLFSCENEKVNYTATNNLIVLDTLKTYDDYIVGDLDGKLFVSTNVYTKSYSASLASLPIDSSHIQFQLAYKLMNNNVEKAVWVTYRFTESKSKLDPNNFNRYKYFPDFVGFFDRLQFDYFQLNQPIENIHSVYITYQNYYDINTNTDSYSTQEYDQAITSENFIFSVDSTKVIENPIKKVSVYFSYKCIGVNQYSNELRIKNGKGKSTFEFN